MVNFHCAKLKVTDSSRCNGFKLNLVRFKNSMKFIFIVFSFFVLTISCSKKSSTVERSNKICFDRTATELKIENNTGKIIYFAAFGQNILPVINWGPFCRDNFVSANTSVNKKLVTITGYSANDKLVIYWWECPGGISGQIQNIILNKSQVICL
jgi:hypothetical protein